MTTLENLFSCFGDDYFNDINDCSKRTEKPFNTDAREKHMKRKAEIDFGPSQKNIKYDPMRDVEFDVSGLDPGINVHTIAKDDGCLHEVAVPPNQKFPKLIENKNPPAKTYKFVLDSFQEKAIACVENNQSVLVSAHTSAGKTVVAEYAIALALKNKQRVIYTTPIKALSNQKYREILEEFKDVGLMTGDITIDPMASCLIMTTEILRSMLFRGSEVTKEVGWVIFDEIHYMRDKQRGVVWEETLILLPDNVRYVFLSATIPNARQFAEWVCHLHQQPCHVIYTEYRPTPLQHYLFPAGGEKMHLVIDEHGTLIQKNFDAAISSVCVETIEFDPNTKTQARTKSSPSENVFNVVNVLMDKQLAPLIIFSFRKKDCEIYAKCLANLNFNTEVEQKLVDEVFYNAIDILSDSEKQLPQITTILPLLRKGIAFHHSGLLPLIKETVEILFGEGLIKALFATETFAMGLNMPAKTVIFTTIKKFDGVKSRNVSSGEYIQMSGRAGRRGLDANGLIVLMIDEKISSNLVSQMMMGKADPLNSAFHLTYHMILNLMRQEEINPEYMIEKSFLVFQTRAKLLELNRNLKVKQRKYAAIHITNEDDVSSYCSLIKQLEDIHDEINFHVLNSENILPFLQKGRLVKLKCDDCEYDWGIIMEVIHKKKKKRVREIQIRIMLHVQGESKDNNSLPKPAYKKKKGRVGVFTVDYKLISQISSEKAKMDGKNKRDRSKEFLSIINNLKATYPNGLPSLHPVNDMGIDNPRVADLLERVNFLENLLTHNSIHGINNDVLISNFSRKELIEKEIFEIKEEIENHKSLLKIEELQRRKNVLRKMGYCNEMDVINMKGRVACELGCIDELMLTEMIFNGIFTELSAEYCVALLSCFVSAELDDQRNIDFDETIQTSINKIKDIASSIGNIAVETKLIEKKEDYVFSCFQLNLIKIVLAWCKGAPFLDICRMTRIYEGSIIRYLRMLEEVLRQLCKAATNVGNTDLENRFSEGIRILKRGVVFAGSLYL